MATPVSRVAVKAKPEPGALLKILWNAYSQCRDSGCKPLGCLDKWTRLITSPAHNRMLFDVIADSFIFISLLFSTTATARVHLDCSLFLPVFCNKMFRIYQAILNAFASLLEPGVFLETLNPCKSRCGGSLCCKGQYHAEGLQCHRPALEVG